MRVRDYVAANTSPFCAKGACAKGVGTDLARRRRRSSKDGRADDTSCSAELASSLGQEVSALSASNLGRAGRTRRCTCGERRVGGDERRGAIAGCANGTIYVRSPPEAEVAPPLCARQRPLTSGGGGGTTALRSTASTWTSRPHPGRRQLVARD